MFRGNENENAPETGFSRFPPVIEKIRDAVRRKGPVADPVCGALFMKTSGEGSEQGPHSSGGLTSPCCALFFAANNRAVMNVLPWPPLCSASSSLGSGDGGTTGPAEPDGSGSGGAVSDTGCGLDDAGTRAGTKPRPDELEIGDTPGMPVTLELASSP
jgi:hypothetical protein